MRRTFEHRFVARIPALLDEGVVYICIEFTIAVHLCACGCGREVATPLAPSGWKLVFDGESLTLDPSIGNWSFPCKSHYWLERNRVIPARRWTAQEIAAGRARTARLHARSLADSNREPDDLD